jgi:DNA modification methylase
VDARSLQLADGKRLPDNSVELTITSPPYGSAQKYVRASSLSLNWLSLCDPNQLADLEGRSIGREHLSVKRGLTGEAFNGSSRFKHLLEEVHQRNPSRSLITETYLKEMAAALAELYRVTAVGGHAVIVIGNNTVTGLRLENDNYIAEVMQGLGFDLELALADRIHSRGLMTVRNKSAGLISGETILMFKKRAS